MQDLDVLSIQAVRQMAGNVPNATFYYWVKKGLWTHPIKLGGRRTGIPTSEAQALMAARIAGKSDDDIKALVSELEAARGGIAA